ncbi:MAG: zinc ribbon domain-containing protein [Oscillospiraceae bacterium]|jgi:hypothetical protein|nr:zinc ribbon domain-containing protein [Oscillospiraceae bacterium]
MAICTECGANVPDEIKFCTECGKPMTAAAPAAPPPPATAPAPAPQPAPQPVYAPVAAAPSYPAIGTGGYIGMMILFAIPVIGWLACIIMSFAAKNPNRKHYARATLIMLIIGLILSVVLFFVFKWASGALVDYVNQSTNGALGEFGGLGDLFDVVSQAGTITGN